MQPRIHCELMKVIATEGEKLLLDWTPPPTCPLFLAKNAQCDRGPKNLSFGHCPNWEIPPAQDDFDVLLTLFKPGVWGEGPILFYFS